MLARDPRPRRPRRQYLLVEGLGGSQTDVDRNAVGRGPERRRDRQFNAATPGHN